MTIATVVLLNLLLSPAQGAPQPRTIDVPPLKLLSEERIAQLGADEQKSWIAYLNRSRDRAIKERQLLGEEMRIAQKSHSLPARSLSGNFKALNDNRDAAWFKSDAATHLVLTILSFQTPSGGWSKAVDYSAGPRQPAMHWTSQSGAGWHYCGTIDNSATTQQIQFLAMHFSATGYEPSRRGTQSGIEWLLEAQFPNGGWPQVYPLEPGYHEAITLNDDAMTNVIDLLLSIAKGTKPFEFVQTSVRERARDAVKRGVECWDRCQVVIDGQRTVWCAQHDPLDLTPVGARAKEPASLSGSESAELIKLLMRKADDNPATRTMIDSAVKWFDSHRITNLRKVKSEAGQTDYVHDNNSTEVYWARFYDLKTLKPIFAGGQDGVIYDTFGEMAKNNKVGYDYFTTKPRDVVTKELQRWKKRVRL